MLVLQFLDYLFLLGASLAIFQVVHIKFVLKIVNIGVLLDISAVEALQFGLKPLILLLEFRLHVFNTLQALISPL